MTNVKFWLTTILPASPLTCLFAWLLSWFHLFSRPLLSGSKKKKFCPCKIYRGIFFFFNSSWSSSPLTFESVQTFFWSLLDSCSKLSCSSASSAGHKSHLSLFSGPGIPKGSRCILFSVVLPPSLGWVSLGPRHPLYTRKYQCLSLLWCPLAD